MPPHIQLVYDFFSSSRAVRMQQLTHLRHSLSRVDGCTCISVLNAMKSVDLTPRLKQCECFDFVQIEYVIEIYFPLLILLEHVGEFITDDFGIIVWISLFIRVIRISLVFLFAS